jgi:hypothetical protein
LIQKYFLKEASPPGSDRHRPEAEQPPGRRRASHKELSRSKSINGFKIEELLRRGTTRSS